LKKPVAQRASAPQLSEAQAKHAEAVCRKVVSRFGTFQPSDLDDLVQEALASLVEAPPARGEDGGMCALGCLSRAVGKYKRAALKRHKVLEEKLGVVARTLKGRLRQESASEYVERAEDVKKIIDRALIKAKLTPAETRYVTAYLGGERPMDTASRFGVSRPAVCKTFYRAVAKLANVIEWPIL
jgi:DNA-directed RNA polymerase specialized sigma24 family protein